MKWNNFVDAVNQMDAVLKDAQSNPELHQLRWDNSKHEMVCESNAKIAVQLVSGEDSDTFRIVFSDEIDKPTV